MLSNAFTHSGSLHGTIPPSFARLTELRCVYFSHASLSGPIPAAASGMTKLQGFFMRENALSGALPDMSGWSDLRSIDLDSNKKLQAPRRFLRFCSDLRKIRLRTGAAT